MLMYVGGVECGVIEESPPLRGRFVPPSIRDLENRRDYLSGQSAAFCIGI